MGKKAKPYRPKDINQLAKYLVDLSTGAIEEKEEKVETVRLMPPAKKKEKKTDSVP